MRSATAPVTGLGFTMKFSKKWKVSFFYNDFASNANLTSQNFFLSAGIKFSELTSSLLA